jgi:hypothetical protein
MSNELKNNNGGFNVPTNYFEQLKQQVANKIQLMPYTHKNNAGFNVPKGYFSQLNLAIKLKTSGKQNQLRIKIITRYAAVAAVFFVAVFLFLFEPTFESKPNLLTDEAIINHLQNEGFSLDLLCDAGWCNELNESNNSNLEEYLLNQTDAYEWYN